MDWYMDIDRQFWKFSPMTGSSQKSQNQFWPFHLVFFKIENTSDKICRVYGGTITEHPQGILGNGMDTPTGIPFSKMPCIGFPPPCDSQPLFQ
jgi:hypothetical protein